MDKRNASPSLALGIDIGGSHITAGMVDPAQKKVIETSVVRQLVNRHSPAAEILGVWAATINDRLLKFQQQGTSVGVAMPGPSIQMGFVLYVNGEITNARLNVLPFKHGMAEEYLSARWFIQTYQQYTGIQVNGVKELADRYYEDAN